MGAAPAGPCRVDLLLGGAGALVVGFSVALCVQIYFLGATHEVLPDDSAQRSVESGHALGDRAANDEFDSHLFKLNEADKERYGDETRQYPCTVRDVRCAREPPCGRGVPCGARQGAALELDVMVNSEDQFSESVLRRFGGSMGMATLYIAMLDTFDLKARTCAHGFDPEEALLTWYGVSRADQASVCELANHGRYHIHLHVDKPASRAQHAYFWMGLLLSCAPCCVALGVFFCLAAHPTASKLAPMQFLDAHTRNTLLPRCDIDLGAGEAGRGKPLARKMKAEYEV